MYNENLINLSNDFLHFLWIIKNNMFSEENLIKKFPYNIEKELDKYIEKYPMPPSHIKVLYYLNSNNKCSVSQIAKSLNISKPNMTPIIDRLISYDLVSRYTDSNDRRILRIELTPKAIEIFECLKSTLVENVCAHLSLLSDQDLKTLQDSINNISLIVKKLV